DQQIAARAAPGRAGTRNPRSVPSGLSMRAPEMTMRQSATRHDGQAAVELALALPLLLLVVFGLLGAGRLTATIVSVSAVAREAARAGALGTSSADAAVRRQLR